MKKISFGAVIWMLLLMASGCVPNRKVIFLQREDATVRARKQLPVDSVLRTHSMVIDQYIIQPLDLLNIQFETLSDQTDAFDFLSKLAPQMRSGGGGGANAMVLNGVFVNMEGEVEYAVLGKIKVSGLSIFEAQERIRQVAAQFVPDVIVRVRMLNFRFTLLGEVNTETVVTSNNPRLTMMEAIGMAGGFSELADRSRVKVIRQRGAEAEVFYVDLLTEDFIESPYYYVHQNDVIIVPPLQQRTFRRYFTSNLGVISSVISFGLLIYTLSTFSNSGN